MSEQQLQEIDISMTQASKLLDDANALKRLSANDDFKQIILEGYFKEEASKQVLMKAEPGMESEDMQVAVTKVIDSIGTLRQHFIAIQQFGMMAEKTLREGATAREEILAEDLNSEAH